MVAIATALLWYGSDADAVATATISLEILAKSFRREILSGALLYHVTARPLTIPERFSRIVSVAREASPAVGLLLLGITVFTVDATTPWPGLWSLAPVVATVLVRHFDGRAEMADVVARVEDVRRPPEPTAVGHAVAVEIVRTPRRHGRQERHEAVALQLDLRERVVRGIDDEPVLRLVVSEERDALLRDVDEGAPLRHRRH